MMKVDIDDIKADENGMVRLKDLQEAAMDDRLNEWQQLPIVIKVLTSYEMGHWLRRRQGRIEEQTIDRILEIIDKATADYEAMPTEIDVGREKAVISFEKKDGMLAMASMIRVLALKGEQG